MFAIRAIIPTALLCCSLAAGQDNPPKHAPNPAAPGKAVVDVYLSTEHAPTGLKTGDKVMLMRVNGKSVTPKGKTAYACAVVVPEAVVVGVVDVEKPKSPEQAIKVQLQTTKDQAKQIERIKVQVVTTYESIDGHTEAKKTPVTLRIELPKPEKKTPEK
jgi:hypothetical protein